MQQRIDWSNPANGQRLLAAILAAQGMKVSTILDLYIWAHGCCLLLPFSTSLLSLIWKSLYYKSFVVKRLFTTGMEVLIWPSKRKHWFLHCIDGVFLSTARKKGYFFVLPAFAFPTSTPDEYKFDLPSFFPLGKVVCWAHSTYWADINRSNFSFTDGL